MENNGIERSRGSSERLTIIRQLLTPTGSTPGSGTSTPSTTPTSGASTPPQQFSPVLGSVSEGYGSGDRQGSGSDVIKASGQLVSNNELDNQTCMWWCFQSDQTRQYLLSDLNQQGNNPSYDMGDKLRWAGEKFCSAIKFVTENKAETGWGKALCSVANITARQMMFSVFWQTTVRQIVARLFGEMTINNPGIGWAMGVMPTIAVLGLNLWGHLRDLRSGREVDALFEEFSESVREKVLDVNPHIDQKAIDELCAALIRDMNNNLENQDEIQEAIYAKPNQDPSDKPENHKEIHAAIMKVTHDPEKEKKEDESIELQDEDIVFDLHPPGMLSELNEKIDQLDNEIIDDVRALQDMLKNKTWPTTTVTVLRCASSIAIGTLAGTAAYTGVLPKIGATLASFALYCVERELAQMIVMCPDGLHKYHPAATFFGALSYIPNQFLGGFAMSVLAGASGQSGVGLSFTDALKNDLIRGAFNGLGEIVDLIVLVLGQSLQNDLSFKVKLEFIKITNYEGLKETMEKLQNTFTALGASRLGIFQETIIFSSLFFNFVEIDESAGEYGKKAIVALVEAIYLGCRYSDLIARGGRVSWPWKSETQLTLSMQR